MKEKNFVIALLLACSISVSAQQNDTAQPSPRLHRLMPVPSAIHFLSGRLKIDASFTVGTDGHTDARLEAGIYRASRRLEGRTGFEFRRGPASDSQTATLLIQCKGPGSPVPSIKEDESYSLEVSEKQADLRAATVIGAIRGLETFLQMLEGDVQGYILPSVSIHDKPR